MGWHESARRAAATFESPCSGAEFGVVPGQVDRFPVARRATRDDGRAGCEWLREPADVDDPHLPSGVVCGYTDRPHGDDEQITMRSGAGHGVVATRARLVRPMHLEASERKRRGLLGEHRLPEHEPPPV